MVGELVQMRTCDLARPDLIVIADIGPQVTTAMLELDFETHPELRHIEPRRGPIDADRLANRTRCVVREREVLSRRILAAAKIAAFRPPTDFPEVEDAICASDLPDCRSVRSVARLIRRYCAATAPRPPNPPPPNRWPKNGTPLLCWMRCLSAVAWA
jgi:hypothetical protein